MTQLRIPAVYMRGGTSKGVFFVAQDLPADPAKRDRILLRVIGSPDRYGQHIDGMGGATSSTSKVVLVSRSARRGFDVDYLFGAVSIDKAVIDWSGNCGNLTSAVGPFAIGAGLVAAPQEGEATVRIWQANIRKPIVARILMHRGEVVEEGTFELDGVTFPSAEVKLEFIDPAGDDASSGRTMFPTGHAIDMLDAPGIGRFEATLIDAGNPTVFIDAGVLRLRGSELQRDVNGNAELLERAEAIRAQGAVAMGLVDDPKQASATRPATPKLAFVALPLDYVASDGKPIGAASIDLVARIFSMGKLHHAMTGTGAVAIATAAAIPGTLVHRLAPADATGQIRFGHPSGALTVGAEVRKQRGAWIVKKVSLSRSARRLMEGWVRVPAA